MFFRHIIKTEAGEYFIGCNRWTKKPGEATLFNTTGDANVQLALLSDEDLARNLTVEMWALVLFRSAVKPCTHPDHVDGQSCEDRAVGCRADCPCCCPPEKQLGWERPREWMYFVEELKPGHVDIVVCPLDLEYADDADTVKVFTDAYTLWAYLVDQQVTHVYVHSPDAALEQFENYFQRLGMVLRTREESKP